MLDARQVALNPGLNDQTTSTIHVMDESYYMKLFTKYKNNREMLNKFHLEMLHIDDIPETIMKQVIKKLDIASHGQRDIGDGMYAELNVIYDYCTFYHYKNGENLLTSHLKQHPELLKGKLKKFYKLL